jgi:hypothetical protein
MSKQKSDRVQEAAERLRRCRPPDSVHEGVYSDMDEMAADSVEVAEAYLDGPAWHDKPTGPGRWLSDYYGRDFRMNKSDMTMEHPGRWYGPIPDPGASDVEAQKE